MVNTVDVAVTAVNWFRLCIHYEETMRFINGVNHRNAVYRQGGVIAESTIPVEDIAPVREPVEAQVISLANFRKSKNAD